MTTPDLDAGDDLLDVPGVGPKPGDECTPAELRAAALELLAKMRAGEARLARFRSQAQ